jgi:hypothetical protein
MTTLTVNEAARETLKQATDLVEVRDLRGTVIGYFAPVSPERAHLYDLAVQWNCPEGAAAPQPPVTENR